MYLIAFGTLSLYFTTYLAAKTLTRGYLTGPWLWVHLVFASLCSWAW